jgi:hypothetical protein
MELEPHKVKLESDVFNTWTKYEIKDKTKALVIMKEAESYLELVF